MASGTELASVIGTWAAVGLALVALLGIITPILLIRRANSERNLALNAIDDEGHEFVRRHIKMPGLRNFGRSIIVPNLENAPALHGQSLRRYDRAFEKKHSATGWIMFARILHAYSIEMPLGGNLKIYQSQAWLPVHKLWILTIGLLGRYGHRADRGRVRSAPTEDRIDQRAIDHTDDSDDRNILSGITGELCYTSNALSSDMEQGMGQLYFIARDKEARGSLQPDDVPLKLLFWMSFGCVPLSDGRIFDVYKDTVASKIKKYTIEHHQLVGRLPDRGVRKVEAYRFQPIEDLMPGARIISWARSLLGSVPELWWLHEYKPTTSEEQAAMQDLLEDCNDVEGISSPWIKAEDFRIDEWFEDEVLLWRSDIQSLALGILKLEWSPRGCLFDTKRGRFCRRIMCQASSSLASLSRAALGISESSIPMDSGGAGFNEVLRTVISMCTWKVTSGFSRGLHEALFALEQALLNKSSRTIHSLAVGIVFITSEMFRKFVLSLVEEKSSNNSNCKVLIVDVISGHVLVNASSNLKFSLNFGEVFGPTEELAPVTLTREEVIFAALGASVRSVAFQFSFDSEPLLHLVGCMDELVYVSARSGMPSSTARSGMPSSRDDSASSMPRTLESPEFYAMEEEIIRGDYRSDNSSHNSDGGHITSDDSDNHKSHFNYTDRAESDGSEIFRIVRHPTVARQRKKDPLIESRI